MNPEWLTAIGTISAVFLALILALFHDHLRAFFWKPQLNIELENHPPDCHLTTLSIPNLRINAMCYYFRIRVINTGNVIAKNVEVFLEKIRIKKSNGKYEPYEEFLPMNLVWSHFRKLYCPGIAPKLYKHCDIGHIVDPERRQIFPGEYHSIIKDFVNQSVMSLDLIVKPNTGTHLIKPGFYQFVLVVAAENAKPNRRKLELNLTGKWFKDERKMLEEGVCLRII